MQYKLNMTEFGKSKVVTRDLFHDKCSGGQLWSQRPKFETVAALNFEERCNQVIGCSIVGVEIKNCEDAGSNPAR